MNSQLIQKVQFEVFADYHFFLVEDAGSDINLLSWPKEAIAHMIATSPGVLAIGTARDTMVPVIAEVMKNDPQDDYTNWDHVNEASITTPSGTLVIAGCTDYLPKAKRIYVAPGNYRARIYYGELDKLWNNDLDGDDHYRIVLWPGEVQPIHILKQWQNAPYLDKMK